MTVPLWVDEAALIAFAVIWIALFAWAVHHARRDDPKPPAIDAAHVTYRTQLDAAMAEFDAELQQVIWNWAPAVPAVPAPHATARTHP